MQQFSWKSATLMTIASMTTGLIIQACGSDVNAVAQTPPTTAQSDAIQGLWQSTVTLRNCASGATLASFRGLTLFNQGGTANADSNQPSTTKGAALGIWKRNADGSYAASFRFWRYNADATPAGSQRLTRAIALAADGNSLTSTISSQTLDNTDNVLQSACGTETAVRVS